MSQKYRERSTVRRRRSVKNNFKVWKNYWQYDNVQFMKISLAIVALILIVPLGFLAFTYFTPYRLGFTGEQAVGFYQMSVVGYEITDYNDGEVIIYETYGDLSSFLSYLTSRDAEAAFGVKNWRS